MQVLVYVDADDKPDYGPLKRHYEDDQGFYRWPTNDIDHRHSVDSVVFDTAAGG